LSAAQAHITDEKKKKKVRIIGIADASVWMDYSEISRLAGAYQTPAQTYLQTETKLFIVVDNIKKTS
jgi:hypothetical protein